MQGKHAENCAANDWINSYISYIFINIPKNVKMVWTASPPPPPQITFFLTQRYEKDRQNIDSFREFIEKFRLFSNRSEALPHPPPDWQARVRHGPDVRLHKHVPGQAANPAICGRLRRSGVCCRPTTAEC